MDYKLTKCVYKGNDSDVKRAVAKTMSRVSKEIKFKTPVECAEFVARFYEEIPGAMETYNFSCDSCYDNEYYVTGYYWSADTDEDVSEADIEIEFTFAAIPSYDEWNKFTRAFN